MVVKVNLIDAWTKMVATVADVNMQSAFDIAVGAKKPERKTFPQTLAPTTMLILVNP